MQKSTRLEKRYRPLYKIATITAANPSEPHRQKPAHAQSTPFVIYSKKKHINSLVISVDLLERPFMVATAGYYTLQGEKCIDNLEFTPFENNEIPTREYPKGRIMRLTIERHGNSPHENLKLGDLSTIFSVVFNEILRSILPNAGRFILISGTTQEEDKYSDSPARFLPLLDGSHGLVCDRENTLQILFLEDSTVDTGALKALYDNWQALFALTEDYLLWLTKRVEKGLDLGFFSFNSTSVPEGMFLPEAFELCIRLNKSSSSRLTHKRNLMFESDNAESIHESRICDFCGETTSSEYAVFEDGREQCYQCRQTSINSLKELEQVYQTAHTWLTDTFGIALRKGITVSFASADSLASKQGASFVSTSGFDRRSVGFTLKNEEGHNTGICIENGQPYHMTLGTIVHELTHIWQFDSLNMDSIEKVKIEGHAMWAEINCLLSNGLGIEYCNHEKHRADIYGQGYRLIDNLVKDDVRGRDPFALLQEMYER